MSTPRSSRVATRYVPDSYRQAPTAPAPAIDGNSRPVPNFSASRPFTSHAAARSGNPPGGSAVAYSNNGSRMMSAGGSEGRVAPGDVLARSRNDVLPGYGFVFDDHVDWSRAVPPPTGASLRPPPPPPDAGRVANAHNPSWIFTYPLPEGHPALEAGGPAGAGYMGHRARQPPQPTTARRAFERELNEHLRLDPPPRPSSSAFHRAAAGGGGGGVSASQLLRTSAATANTSAFVARAGPPRTLSAAESAAAVGLHRATPGRSPASAVTFTGAPITVPTNHASTTSEDLQHAASTLGARNDVDAALELAVQRALLADLHAHTHVTHARAAAPNRPHLSASSLVTPVRPVLSRQAGGSDSGSPEERRPAPVSAFATTSAATSSSAEPATASTFATPTTTTTAHVAATPSGSRVNHAAESMTPARAAGVSTSFTPSRGALLLRRRTPAEAGGVADALSGDGYYHQHQRSLTPSATRPSAHRHVDPVTRLVGGSASLAATTDGGNGAAWQISDFSYDALLRINGGTVPTGLSKRQLERYVPRPYAGAGPGGDATCTVCLEAVEIGALSLTLGCQHAFHGPCILQWLARTNQCPTCRFEIPHLNGM